MLADIETHRADVARLCAEHGVLHLDVFGSAADGPFDPARSDIDFVVEFGPHAQPELFRHYFELKQALEQLFARDVDLVMAGALRNPHFAAAVERTRRPVYASAVAQAA